MHTLVPKFSLTVICFFSAIASAADVCEGLYGKHKFYFKVNHLPVRHIEIEIEKNGDVTSDYHFNDHYVETVVFSRNYPQSTLYNSTGKATLDCSDSEADCSEVHFRVKGYAQTLLTQNYIDAGQRDTEHRKAVLNCATIQMQKTLLEEFPAR